MRIGYVSTDPGVPYGGVKGASVHVAELIDALAAEGASVLGLVSGIAPNADPPARRASVEVLPEAERTRWIEQRLASFGADVLYERLALHSAAGTSAARRLGIPHFVELNAPLLDEAHRYRHLDERAAAARLETATIANADLVFAVSRPLAAYARSRGARRVEVLPNAVAVDRYPLRRTGRGRRAVAVFSGRVRPWHGIDTVAEAWRLLGAGAPGLVIAGEAGPARELLASRGAELLGPIPHRQVPAVLAEADIGLAPYAPDAPDYFSPLKVFEYMAAGLAVVACDLPAVRELLSEDSAVLVPRGDPEALATAVAGLSLDTARRERLGRTARELVAAGHTWRDRARVVIDRAATPALARARPREAVGT